MLEPGSMVRIRYHVGPEVGMIIRRPRAEQQVMTLGYDGKYLWRRCGVHGAARVWMVMTSAGLISYDEIVLEAVDDRETNG